MSRQQEYVVYNNNILSTETNAKVEYVIQRFALNADSNNPEQGHGNFWLSGPGEKLTEEEKGYLLDMAQEAKMNNEVLVMRPIKVVFSK